jgi:hypothetical protein
MTGAALRMTWRGGTTEGNEGEIVKNISRESQQDRERPVEMEADGEDQRGKCHDQESDSLHILDL